MPGCLRRPFLPEEVSLADGGGRRAGNFDFGIRRSMFALPMASASSAVPTPEHKVYESPNTRSIKIKDWTITVITKSIATAGECDALQAELGIPLPEMIFANNSLSLRHHPSGWEYSYDAPNALKYVRSGELQPGDGGVKVGYADAWLKSRC
jgi:type 2A phosphatase activator TIP41